MAKQKISDEQWAQARARWESEPKLNFADVGETLGVSKQSVQQQAKKNGWVKRLAMGAIVSRAHAIADKTITQDSVGESTQAPSLVAGSPEKITFSTPEFPAGASAAQLTAIGEDAAVAARAELVSRHRRETNNARHLVYGAIRTKNPQDAKVAKIVVESIKLLQETERKAWGIDGGEEEKAVRIIVERGGRRGN